MATPKTIARSKEALRLHYDGSSLAEIGTHFGISRERARQLLAIGRAVVCGVQLDTLPRRRVRAAVLLALAGVPLRDIAAELNVREESVRRYLQASGVFVRQYVLSTAAAEALGIDSYRAAATGAQRTATGWAAKQL